MKVLLRDKGIIPVIITGRESKIDEMHAKDLGITEVSACPANAANEVKAAVDYVCIRNGGDGAVREFVEWIICNNQRSTPC